MLFILLVFCCQLKLTQAGIFKVANADCVNASLAVWQQPHPSDSMTECIASSRSVSIQSVGVVQLNRRDASCALFRFGQVCQLLSLINISSSVQTDCKIVVDSEYDAIAANKHFNAVWVADRGPSLENLVCGPDGRRNPVKFSNILWTSEGARMNGLSSRLWVDDPTGLDFTGSYTWVLHLKRTPGENCFLELSNCDLSGMKDHFWEFSYPSGVSLSLYLSPGLSNWFQSSSALPSDSQQFSIVGLTFDRPAGRCKFFLGSAFLPGPLVNFSTNAVYGAAGACVKIGWRSASSGILDGVFRAVAVANSALTENEIRQLFRQL